MHQPRLLFLDAYDSFSNNIITLLHDQLNATVEVIHIDDKRFATKPDAHFHEYLRRFDGVVAGPGPGDPRNPTHLGLIGRLWTLPDHLCLPILGVCLGFQSLALAFGASVEKLREPRHGLITELSHCGRSLFKDAGVVKATQYHSLHVRLNASCIPTDLARFWQSAESCPSLEPLAWDLSDARNGPVLMALKHESKPFWGVQYHPESICTNTAGALIIRNWWSEALNWSISQAAIRKADPGPSISASYAFDLDSGYTSTNPSPELSGRSSFEFDAASTGHTLPTAKSTPAATRDSSRIRQPSSCPAVLWESLDLPNHEVPVTSLLESLQNVNGNAIMLESGTKDGKPVRAETGRFSIISCLDESPRSMRYSTSKHILEANLSGHMQSIPATMKDVWSTVETFMAAKQAIGGPTVTPFWGGLVGYISYEAGLETIDVAPQKVKETHPDVWFVFVERSVVVDHVNKKLYLQSLREEDTEWIQQTRETIKDIFDGDGNVESAPSATQTAREMSGETTMEKKISKRSESQRLHERDVEASPTVTAPEEHEYAAKVRLCQSSIRDGDSYELCLTDQSRVAFPDKSQQPSAWELYHRLRSTNPAPFGAYLRFEKRLNINEDEARCDGLTILSSSPERFLSWSRGGNCQFRPIKGTVLKTDSMTREMAEAILNSEKEQAENLMIVDLIRHDLHGVVGPGNVEVKKLMQVEEYETVYQLVSVIEGQLCLDKSTGVDVLAASLPPGSMTGAPKKRSCELLTEIEGTERGIYSGVLGYFDVGGGGDFSVVIRTAFQWSDEGEWRLGAGGAVTVLSTEKGEFEEMMAKRASSIRAFL